MPAIDRGRSLKRAEFRQLFFSALSGCACFVGCGTGASERQSVWVAEIDTLDGVIRVRNPADPMCVLAPAIERELTIGATFGDSAYELVSVWDIDVDEGGNIYVADPGRHQVLVYDDNGHSRRIIGREGDGPGEFRLPTSVEWLDGMLAVLDRVPSRLSFFTGGGVLVRDTTVRELRYLADFAWTSTDILLVQIGPNWMSPPIPGEYGIGRLIFVDISMTRAPDTLVDWSDSTASVHFAAPGVSLVAEVPFGPRSLWAPTSDGGFYFTEGAQYKISQYNSSGGIIREIHRDYQPVVVSRAERDSVRARIESYDRRLADQIRIPVEKPAVRALRVDNQGRLWARVSLESESQSQQWDIFASDGAYLFAVSLPARIDVKVVDNSHVYGVTRDSLGVVHVQRYRYRLPC